MNTKSTARAADIIEMLAQTYPDNLITQLEHKTPFQLLVATILSAQSTDVQVNKITRKLFQKYTSPEDYAYLVPESLEPLIKGCGLYKNKSRNIIRTSRILVEKHRSQIPKTMKELTNLPGVGRKTASVVLSGAFGVPTMPVDTHVFRVAKRLGLASANTPLGVEKELLALIPPGHRGPFHHRLIEHGRKVCKARKPRCLECILNKNCRRCQLLCT